MLQRSFAKFLHQGSSVHFPASTQAYLIHLLQPIAARLYSTRTTKDGQEAILDTFPASVASFASTNYRANQQEQAIDTLVAEIIEVLRQRMLQRFLDCCEVWDARSLLKLEVEIATKLTFPPIELEYQGHRHRLKRSLAYGMLAAGGTEALKVTICKVPLTNKEVDPARYLRLGRYSLRLGSSTQRIYFDDGEFIRGLETMKLWTNLDLHYHDVLDHSTSRNGTATEVVLG